MKLQQLLEQQSYNILTELNKAVKSKERNIDLEKKIIQIENANMANRYARCVLQRRWPEAERFIILFPDTACYYARDVIKDRWPEAEPRILKNQNFKIIHHYATDVIKGRWPEAEPLILTKPYDAIRYASEVIKGRWPELEKLLERDDVYYRTWCNAYLRSVPSARHQSKDECLKLGFLEITDVPDTISDDQVKQLIHILFPSATEDDLENIIHQRIYDRNNMHQRYFESKPNQYTTKQIREKEWSLLTLFKEIDELSRYLYDVFLRQKSDFEDE